MYRQSIEQLKRSTMRKECGCLSGMVIALIFNHSVNYSLSFIIDTSLGHACMLVGVGLHCHVHDKDGLLDDTLMVTPDIAMLFS